MLAAHEPQPTRPRSAAPVALSASRFCLTESSDCPAPRVEQDGRTITSLADRYDGKRLNSPNDLRYGSRRNLYLTHPPYGLEDRNNSELKFNGVYLLRPGGELIRTPIKLSFPN